MTQGITTKHVAAMAALALAVFSALPARAQLIRGPLDRGFAATSSIEMSVDEALGSQKERQPEEPIVGPGYPALWISEVQFKPIRLIRLTVNDPKTGQPHRELVWYLVYRVIPRDYTELAGDGRDDLLQKLSDPNFTPENVADPIRAERLRIPRFTLKTTDIGAEQTYTDEVNLEVQQAVLAREFGSAIRDLKLYNSVEAIGEVPEPVSVHDEDPLSHALYGVAVWRNVDPRTDFFTLHISGFSNAYRIRNDSDGNRVVEEKVITQKFVRPGDEFVQDEQEFRLVHEETAEVQPGSSESPTIHYPRWEYQARNVDLKIPNDADSILRNAQR